MSDLLHFLIMYTDLYIIVYLRNFTCTNIFN